MKIHEIVEDENDDALARAEMDAKRERQEHVKSGEKVDESVRKNTKKKIK